MLWVAEIRSQRYTPSGDMSFGKDLDGANDRVLADKLHSAGNFARSGDRQRLVILLGW
jgi:hypothetical protein